MFRQLFPPAANDPEERLIWRRLAFGLFAVSLGLWLVQGAERTAPAADTPADPDTPSELIHPAPDAALPRTA